MVNYDIYGISDITCSIIGIYRNQSDANSNQSPLGHSCFSALQAQFAYFDFKFLLAPCDVFF